MIIEIKGVQFVNKGAELMLMAVIEQIRRRWPAAEIALEVRNDSPYLKRARLGAYQKSSLRWSVREYMLDLNQLSYTVPQAVNRWGMRKWGVVTENDIDAVFDVSGFAYGDQWPTLVIKRMAAELVRYYRAGKPYVFLPQAFGPFTRIKDRERLRSSLPLATLIAARDSDSFQHVSDLFDAAPDNLTQFPDFTNLIDGRLPDYFDEPQRKIIVIPNSRMLSENNVHESWRDSYLPLLQHSLEVVRELGYMPVILNHEGPDDARICHELAALDERSTECINEDDPIMIKGMIGAARAVICSRFHGCVSALSQGVPCLGTSWSHKYERLFEDYGRSEFVLSPDTDRSGLAIKLREAIDGRDDGAYMQALAEQKRMAEALWDEVEGRIATFTG